MNMKYFLRFISLLLISLFSVNAQTSKTENENKSAPANLTENKRNVIQLTPFGYASLPKAYWAYMDNDWMDAWAGVIEPLNGSFKIRFSDGLVSSVFEGEDKNIKWRKELKAENNLITYALSDNGISKRILAKIGSANFSAKVENDAEIEKFLEIIGNYRKGRCENCFNSRTTKYLKKHFKKQIEND